ncbi:PREDICTED: uncharacterized protein LOC105127198 isoform X1 [Populus euphratica]|uniref:Uncharacterized protein LOC105127198 isoform X1 n=1 Tax=Populus euphratica TaxID=75702 RepID=A0AAJ6UBJ5_POPEU|nr:PREDICTED: uncharacterized protein LOC105127198 isoform X1 [Populus euphratica]XP_011026685.1 PREDICTED: uncharacterized protein LOC105127198 isoform X1 [Populus euphratica]
MDNKMIAIRKGRRATRSMQKRKPRDTKLTRSIKRIRADMAEINEGQERIRDGQKEVREKFEEISKETAKLKEETNIIIKQSAANQVRLDLMFQIIKARSENDAPRDAVLTQILRELINGKAEPELKQAPRGEAITRSIN